MTRMVIFAYDKLEDGVMPEVEDAFQHAFLLWTSSSRAS